MAKKDNTALAWGVGLATVVVAGIGIYFYEKSQPAAPTTAPTLPAAAGTNVANQVTTAPGFPAGTTNAQVAALAASLDSASLSTWQSSGIPAASWSQMSAAVQSVMTSLGYHANAT